MAEIPLKEPLLSRPPPTGQFGEPMPQGFQRPPIPGVPFPNPNSQRLDMNPPGSRPPMPGQGMPPRPLSIPEGLPSDSMSRGPPSKVLSTSGVTVKIEGMSTLQINEQSQSEVIEFDTIVEYLNQRFDKTFPANPFEKNQPPFEKLYTGPDGKFLIIRQGFIELRERRPVRINPSLKVCEDKITSIAFILNPGKIILALGDNIGKIHLISYPVLVKETTLSLHESPITCLRFSKKDSFLYSSANNLQKINTHDWSSEIINTKPVTSFDFYDDDIVYSGSRLRFLNGTGKTLIKESFTHVSVSEKFIVAGNQDKIKVWKRNLEEFKEFKEVVGISKLEIVRDDAVFVFTVDGCAKLLNLEEDCDPIVIRVTTGLIDAVGDENFEFVYLLTHDFLHKYRIHDWDYSRKSSAASEIQGIVSGPSKFVYFSESILYTRSSNSLDLKELNLESSISKIFLNSEETTLFVLCNKNLIKAINLLDLSSCDVYSSLQTVWDFTINSEGTLLVVSDTSAIITFYDLVGKAILRTIDKTFKNMKPQLICLQLFPTCLYVTTDFGVDAIELSGEYKSRTVFIDFAGKIKKTKVSDDQQYILKCSQRRTPQEPPPSTFKIYLTSREQVLKEFKYHKDSINDFLFTDDKKHFLVASNDLTVSLWCRKTLNLITSIVYYEPISHIIQASDPTKMLIVQGSQVTMTGHPLSCNQIQVFGPRNDLHFEYFMYLKRISETLGKDLSFKQKMAPHNPQFDSFVISPIGMNALHFYAWYVYSEAYEKALANTSFHNSCSGLNPLLLLLIRDEPEIVMSTLDFFTGKVNTEPQCLSFVNTRTLVELNHRGYTGLENFYKDIYSSYVYSSLPKYTSGDLGFPIPYYSQTVDPNSSNFATQESFVPNGTPVSFFCSKISLNMISGSQESLDLVRSIVNCPNTEIYATPFIRLILTDKWKKVKIVMILLGLLYLIYLICLSLYIIYYNGYSLSTGDKENLFVGEVALYVGFAVNLIMILYEIMQMAMTGVEYWQDLWNWIDISRFIMFTVLTVLTLNFESNLTGSIWYSLLQIVLVLVSWIRGLTFFRLFDQTRYLTALIFEVVFDMSSFMVLTFYSVIGLSLMLFCSLESHKDNDYSNFLGFTYMTTIGEYGSFEYGIEKFDKIGTVIFTVTSVLNTIVMMNLLISIIGDTFDRVQQGSAVADLKQLGNMVYEIESLMFWKKGLVENVYMQRLCQKFGSGGDGDVWEGKIRELKNAILYMHKPVVNASNKCDKTTKNTEDLQNRVGLVEKKIDVLANNMIEVKEILNLLVNKLN